MELTWETMMRLTWPLSAETSTIPLRVTPVVFGLEVSFAVAVPLVPVVGLICSQEETGFVTLHAELQVMVIEESAPWA